MSSDATLFLFCSSRSAAAVGGAGGWSGLVGAACRPDAPPPMSPFIYRNFASRSRSLLAAPAMWPLSANLADWRVCVPSALAAVDQTIAAITATQALPRASAVQRYAEFTAGAARCFLRASAFIR